MSQELDSPNQTAAPVQEGIQQGLADRAEAIKGIAQARENLGHVASSHEVHADVHGNILTDSDLKAVASGQTDAKS